MRFLQSYLLLGAILLSGCTGGRAKKKAVFRAAMDAREASAFVWTFIAENRRLPASVCEAVKTKADRWSKEENAVDPWGNSYCLRLSDGKFIVYSMGPNRIDDAGNGDDICSDPIDVSGRLNSANQ
jgi:hypothetical protein